MNKKNLFIFLPLVVISLVIIGYQIYQSGATSQVEMPSEMTIQSDQSSSSIASSNQEQGAENEPEEAFCTQNFQPVCGSVGEQEKTFSNLCQAEKAGASNIHEGMCTQLNSCPVAYEPVCGQVDGTRKTYNNNCSAQLAGALEIEGGSCPQEGCGLEFDPVCASLNGVDQSFDNECLATEAGGIEIRPGSCLQEEPLQDIETVEAI